MCTETMPIAGQNVPADKRDHGLDLLRVLLMLMIPMLHFNSHGGMGEFFSPSEVGWYLMKFLNLASVCAVNVFVLISGYFSVGKKLNVRRVFTTACAIWFYSWAWLVIGKLTDIGTYDFKALLTALFPISFKMYWFPTCYLCLTLLSPFLNKLLNALTQKQYKALLLIGFLLLSLWHDIIPLSDPLNANGGYSLIWFIYLYCVAGYVKLHGESMLRFKARVYGTGYLAVTLLMLSTVAVLTLLGDKIPLIERYDLQANFTKYCSVLTLAQSVLLFLFFKKTDIRQPFVVKTANFLAPLTFGVYLIHDNAATREFIYYNIFRVDALPHNLAAVPAVVGMVVALFLACAAIEFVRKTVFGLWENAAWFKKLFAKLQSKADEL